MNYYVKNKWIYGMIGLTVIAMIVWIIAGTAEPEINEDLQVNQETYTMETAEQEINEPSTEFVNGHYLVKAENNKVNVYWIDGTGEHFHRETSIEYLLLNEEDQEMLEEGIILESDEELAGFLENYDS